MSTSTYDGTSPEIAAHLAAQTGPLSAGPYGSAQDGQWDYYMRGFEPPAGEMPVWLSEHNLGDMALAQQGIEAFLLPSHLADTAVPQIW